MINTSMFEVFLFGINMYIERGGKMGRILIFTGKGGVGKTSVAAAHALASSKEGVMTLIVSTDMAHNLSDIFEQTIGKEEKEVSPNLFALEIDPYHVMDNEFKELQSAFGKLFSFSGSSSDEVNLSIFSGMEELISLLKIMDIYERKIYDRIIIDCAPTGETLSLLKFPELLSWYMEKLFPVGKVAMRILSPISKSMFKVELPDKAAMNDIEKAYLRLAELQSLLRDSEVTSIRLVTIPEKMVVEETKRNYMYMNLFNFQVDGVYINRILPKDIGNPFFEEWLRIQSRYIEELEQVFQYLPIYRIPWFDRDINGCEGLEKLESEVLQGKDIFKLHKELRGEKYEKFDQGFFLKLYIPGVKKGDLELHESASDIIIKIGNFKRNIPKPSTLRNYEITSGKLEEDILTITFMKA